MRARISALLLVIALAFLLWGGCAKRRMTPSTEMPPTQRPGAPTLTPRATLSPASTLVHPTEPVKRASLAEARIMILEWPRTLRQGDGDLVRLTLDIDENGLLTPTVTVEGHDIRKSPIEIPNLYETHILHAEAQLHLAGIEVMPQGPQTIRLYPGEPVTFLWSIRGKEIGTYQGVIPLYLLMTPKTGGDTLRVLLAVPQLSIRVVNFLGLSAFWVRMLGMVSGVLGILLQLPDLWDLWKRLTGRFQEEASPGQAPGPGPENADQTVPE